MQEHRSKHQQMLTQFVRHQTQFVRQHQEIQEHQSKHSHEVGLCSGVAVEVETGGALEVETGVAVEVETCGAVEVETGGALEVETGGAVEVETGGAVEVETGGAVEVETWFLPPLPARAAPPNRPFSCVEREKDWNRNEEKGWGGGGRGGGFKLGCVCTGCLNNNK